MPVNNGYVAFFFCFVKRLALRCLFSQWKPYYDNERKKVEEMNVGLHFLLLFFLLPGSNLIYQVREIEIDRKLIDMIVNSFSWHISLREYVFRDVK